MNEVAQWVLVGVAVVASAIYLIRRLARPKQACGGCSGCSACPHGPDHAAECRDKRPD